MLLASLLVPLAVVAIVLLVQRLHLPVFLAIMATVVVYGIAADMTFQSVGKAFGLGFTAALEQVGLLVVAGALVQALVLRQPLGTGTSALLGALAGLGASAAGGLALLQPAGQDAPRRAVGLALTLLAVSSLVAPSPLAVAAASVMKASNSTMLMVALPLAAIAALLGWWAVARQVPSTAVAGWPDWTWLAVLIPIALLIAQSVAQMPSEPLGKGGAREFYIGISKPLMLAAIAITLGVLFAGRWQPSALAGRSWAPLLLAVGASGGLGRVFDETGMAELLAEYALHPRFGILTPFLAAAIVKTMQGNSLTRRAHRLGHDRAHAAGARARQRVGPRARRRRGRRGFDGDLPCQRSVLLDRRVDGPPLAGPGARCDLARQRGDGDRRPDCDRCCQAVPLSRPRSLPKPPFASSGLFATT